MDGGTGRAGCGEGEERRGRKGRGGESGYAVTYLKVVGIISISAGDQLGHQLFLRRLPVPSRFFIPSAAFPVTWPKKDTHLPAGLVPRHIAQRTQKRGLFEKFTQISLDPEVKLAGGQRRFEKPDRPSHSNRRRMQSDRCRPPIRLSNANLPVQIWMVQTRQNNPSPGASIPSGRTARMSR